jgi:hypothetical protein
MKLLYVTASSPSKKLVHYSAAEDAPWLWYETSDAKRVSAHGGHGTDMFKVHPELPGIIVQWFVTTLIKTPGHAPAETLAAASLLNQLQTPGGAVQAEQQLLEARQKDLARTYAEKGLAMLNSHAAPLSSWSDTEQRRGEIRSSLEDILKQLVDNVNKTN